jgi:hypothetical protein
MANMLTTTLAFFENAMAQFGLNRRPMIPDAVALTCQHSRLDALPTRSARVPDRRGSPNGFVEAVDGNVAVAGGF